MVVEAFSAILGLARKCPAMLQRWIYWFGVKSRLRFPGSRFDWSLVNALTFVGYATDDERSSVRNSRSRPRSSSTR